MNELNLNIPELPRKRYGGWSRRRLQYRIPAPQ